MSHSRIFKIQSDMKEPYEEISENDYYENGFIDGQHDYVESLSPENTKDAYEWLNTSHSRVWHVDEKNGKFYVTVRRHEIEAYLEKQWDLFRNEYYEPLKDRSSYAAKCCLGDPSGFYFDRPGWGYSTEFETLEEIYKELIRTNSSEATFRLEGALDYHC